MKDGMKGGEKTIEKRGERARGGRVVSGSVVG